MKTLVRSVIGLLLLTCSAVLSQAQQEEPNAFEEAVGDIEIIFNSTAKEFNLPNHILDLRDILRNTFGFVFSPEDVPGEDFYPLYSEIEVNDDSLYIDKSVQGTYLQFYPDGLGTYELSLYYSDLYGNEVSGTVYVIVNNQLDSEPRVMHYSNSMYQVVVPPVTWHEAKAYAESSSFARNGKVYRGHLLMINSHAEYDALFNASIPIIPHNGNLDKFWLGASKNSNSTIQWEIGHPLVYTNWSAGQPISTGGNEDVVEMNLDGTWNIVSASEKRSYIIEYIVDPNTMHFEGHYYEEIWNPLDWYDSKLFAELSTFTDQYGVEYAGRLVEINSQEEQEFITNTIVENTYLENYEYWIGGHRTGPDTFAWLSGDEFQYHNWDVASGEPNDFNGTEDSIIMLENRLWNDVNPSSIRDGFIIEYVPKITYNPNTYKYYSVVAEENTWQFARLKAEEQFFVDELSGEVYQGQLASIASQEEQDYIKNVITDGVTTDLWLGGIQTIDPGFFWIAPELFSYTNWDDNEPSLPNQSRIELQPNGKWSDVSDTSTNLGYLVEYLPINILKTVDTNLLSFDLFTGQITIDLSDYFVDDQPLTYEIEGLYDPSEIVGVGVIIEINGPILTIEAAEQFDSEQYLDFLVTVSDVDGNQEGIGIQLYVKPIEDYIVEYSFQNRKFLFLDIPISWDDAFAAATEIEYGGLKGKLAIIDTPELQNFVETNFTNPDQGYWVGGVRTGENNFEWINGKLLSYSNWHSSANQPDNNNGNEDRIEIGISGLWNDTASTEQRPFLIEFVRTNPVFEQSVSDVVVYTDNSVTTIDLSDIADSTNQFNSTWRNVPFILNVSNDNPSVLSASLINDQLQIETIEDQHGDAKITLTVSNIFGESDTQTFTVHVVPVPFQNPENGHYYIKINQRMNLSDANEMASEYVINDSNGNVLQGHLLTINSPVEQEFILENMVSPGDEIWLGAERISEENAGDFAWSTNEPFYYTNWHSGQPNDYQDIDDAVDMKDHGRWHDVPPSWERISIIEFEPVSFYNPENGHYYVINNTELNWSDANDYAESTGFTDPYGIQYSGRLLTVNSQAEQDFILANLVNSGDEIWLGGTRVSNDTVDDFAWVTEEPFDYQNWNTNQPNSNDGVDDAVDMKDHGRWHDVPSSWERISIIEYEPVSIHNPENGHYYIVYPTVLDFDTANELVSSSVFTDPNGNVLNGHLLTINSQAEQDFILANLVRPGDDFWLGARRVSDDPIDHFEWITGEPFLYTNWNEYQPNNYEGISDAIDMKDHGRWHDLPPSWIKMSIFEYQLPNTAPEVTNQDITTLEDQLIDIDLTANDSVDDFLIYTITSHPEHGTIEGEFPLVQYVPIADFTGTDSFTFIASDYELDSEPATVVFNVSPVNDAPSFSLGVLPSTIGFNSGQQQFEGVVTNLVPGPVDEASQELNFVVTTSDDSYFEVLPELDLNGTLTFVPALGSSGIVHVSATLQDNGGTENGGTDTSETLTFPITIDLPLGSLVLLNSSGEGIAGATAQYNDAGTWLDLPGVTDASGEMLFLVDLSGKVKFRMTYEGSNQTITQIIDENPNVTFQTVNTTVDLVDSSGAAITDEASSVEFNRNGWQLFGNTDSGSVSREMLPGNYSFRMTYANGSFNISQNIAENPIVIFETVPVTVSLLDSSDKPISSDNEVTFRGKEWVSMGTLDTGSVTKELLPASYRFRVTHASATVEKRSNVKFEPNITFKTKNVDIELRNSAGELITDGTARIEYNSNGWNELGITDTGILSVELLPKTYNFRIEHKNTKKTKSQNVQFKNTVAFKTARFNLELRDSSDVYITEDNAVAMYNSGGWQEISETVDGSASIELLPNVYNFRMTYLNASLDQKNEFIPETLVFQTEPITVELRDSMDELFADVVGSVEFNSGGWQPMGDLVGGIVTKELLPKVYSFRMNYANASNDKKNDGDGPLLVTFNTKNVMVQLIDSAGYLLEDDFDVEYNSGGWHPLGSSNTGQINMELLPKTYQFRLAYNGKKETQKVDVINPETIVDFFTGQVFSLSNSVVELNSGGWIPFTQNMELLSGNYKFKYADNSKVTYTIESGFINQID